jgi:hypothetical protein
MSIQMRRARLSRCTVLLVAATWMLSLSAAFAADPGPRAVVPEVSHDLGVVAVGSDVVHEFAIRNEGSAPLTLKQGRATRELKVLGYDRTIAPGDTGRITVAVDTWTGVGPGTLNARFSSNDPARPEIVLEVKVHIRPYVLADPGYVRYVVVQGSGEGTVSQTLMPTDGGDFRITRVEAPAYLRVSYREAGLPEWNRETRGRKWILDATILSEAPVGALSGFIAVHLDHPEQKQLRIPISGFVRPVFAVTPPAGHVGDVDPTRPLERSSLIVKNFAREPAVVKDVTTDIPGLSVVVTPIESGRTYRLRLVFSPDAPAGAFDGTIRVETSSPRVPLLEVPVSGRIVSKPPPAAPGPAADRERAR